MRENIDEKLESAPDAASLSRIRVRRPKGTESAPRKLKSGDITDRLQALAEELEATRPASQPAEAATKIPARAPRSSSGSAKPSMPAAEARPSKKTVKARKAAVKPPRGPEAVAADILPEETAPAPSALPPRRAHRARPATTSGWQRKVPTPDILSYWMDIRGAKRYPDWRDLDTAMIGRNWPNCTLVHCNHALGRMQIENGFVSAVRQSTQAENPGRDINSDVEFSPMVIDWVLSLAREVANSGKPAHGTEYFPATFDEVTLRVIALPLSEDQFEIDHVLCYVQKLV